MEDNPHNNISDRDRKMQQRGSFEGFADTSDDDDDEKESSKKSKKESGAAFEQSKEETKAEKNERNDDKLDELDESEAHHIVEEYAEARAEDLKEDLEAAQPDSLEEAVALANAALIEAIQESEPTTEEELDALLAETVEELGLAPAEAAEAEEDEAEDDTTSVTPTTSAAGGSGGTTPPPTVPTPPAAGGAVPPPPPTPITPTPVTPTLGGPLGGAILPPPHAPATPNLAPNPSATNANTWQPNRRRAGQLLLVGGVGYLIGRRRGRIKTEARLLPVQEKLEQEVKSLHDQIAERETKIRKLAAEKVLEQPETARPQLINRIESRVERRQQAQVERQPSVPEYRPPERLAKFVLPGAEVVRGVEVREKSIETMTMPELLTVANNIERNGVTVKQMYENGRLDAEGLRRVVKEYLQGDHLDRVLADNLRPLESYEGEPLTAQKQDDPVAGGFQTQTPLTPLQQQMANPQAPTPRPLQQPAATPPPPRHNQASEVKTAVGLGLGAAVIILLLIILLS